MFIFPFQPHLLAMFENINKVMWDPKEYDRIIACVSRESEELNVSIYHIR